MELGLLVRNSYSGNWAAGLWPPKQTVPYMMERGLDNAPCGGTSGHTVLEGGEARVVTAIQAVHGGSYRMGRQDSRRL